MARRRGGAASFLKGLVGGYEFGRKVQSDMAADEVKSNLADVSGIRTTDVASGEDAYAGARQARENALAMADSDEQRAQVEKDYAPVLDAAEKGRGRAASVAYSIGTGNNFQQFGSKEDADTGRLVAREGIYRKAGMDEEADRLVDRAQSRKLIGMQIDEKQQDKAFKDEWGKTWAGTSAGQAQAAGRDATPAEMLQSSIQMFELQASRGRATPETMMALSDKMKALSESNYAKAVNAMHAGVDVNQVIGLLAEGGRKIDPAAITSYQPVSFDSGDGQKIKTFELTYKDPKTGKETPINAYKEMLILGTSGQAFDRAMKVAEAKRLERQTDASVASSYASANASNTQAAIAKLGIAGATGAGKLAKDPAAELTPQEQAGVQYLTGKIGLEKNTPEKMNEALIKLDSQVKDYLKLGDTALTNLSPDETQKRQAVYLKAMDIGRAALSSNRTIDPAAVIKQAQQAQSITSDPRAIAIRDDKSLTVEQKKMKLMELGYR